MVLREESVATARGKGCVLGMLSLATTEHYEESNADDVGTLDTRFTIAPLDMVDAPI